MIKIAAILDTLAASQNSFYMIKEINKLQEIDIRNKNKIRASYGCIIPVTKGLFLVLSTLPSNSISK